MRISRMWQLIVIMLYLNRIFKAPPKALYAWWLTVALGAEARKITQMCARPAKMHSFPATLCPKVSWVQSFQKDCTKDCCKVEESTLQSGDKSLTNGGCHQVDGPQDRTAVWIPRKGTAFISHTLIYLLPASVTFLNLCTFVQTVCQGQRGSGFLQQIHCLLSKCCQKSYGIPVRRMLSRTHSKYSAKLTPLSQLLLFFQGKESKESI